MRSPGERGTGNTLEQSVSSRGSPEKCESRDLNPDGLPHWILSPARLPIPPLSRGWWAATDPLLILPGGLSAGRTAAGAFRGAAFGVRAVRAASERTPAVVFIRVLSLLPFAIVGPCLNPGQPAAAESAVRDACAAAGVCASFRRSALLPLRKGSGRSEGLQPARRAREGWFGPRSRVGLVSARSTASKGWLRGYRRGHQAGVEEHDVRCKAYEPCGPLQASRPGPPSRGKPMPSALRMPAKPSFRLWTGTGNLHVGSGRAQVELVCVPQGQHSVVAAERGG